MIIAGLQGYGVLCLMAINLGCLQYICRVLAVLLTMTVSYQSV